MMNKFKVTVKTSSAFLEVKEMYNLFLKLSQSNISDIRKLIKIKNEEISKIKTLLAFHKKDLILISNFEENKEYNVNNLNSLIFKKVLKNSLHQFLYETLKTFKTLIKEINTLKTYLADYNVITFEIFNQIIIDYCSLIKERLEVVGDKVYLLDCLGTLQIKEIFTKNKTIIDWHSYHRAKSIKRNLFNLGLIEATEYYEPVPITRMLKEKNAVLSLKKARNRMVHMYAFKPSTKLALKINKAYNVSDARFI